MGRWVSRSKGQGRSKTGGVVWAVIAMMVVLTLMLGVSLVAVGCGGDTAQEKVVRQFLTAAENKDMQAILDLSDPSISEQLEAMALLSGMEVDELIQQFAGEQFPWDSIKFSDITMETTELGDDEAKVEITGGSASMTVDGVTETKSVMEADVPLVLYLYQLDGEWYLDLEQ